MIRLTTWHVTDVTLAGNCGGNFVLHAANSAETQVRYRTNPSVRFSQRPSRSSSAGTEMVDVRPRTIILRHCGKCSSIPQTTWHSALSTERYRSSEKIALFGPIRPFAAANHSRLAALSTIHAASTGGPENFSSKIAWISMPHGWQFPVKCQRPLHSGSANISSGHVHRRLSHPLKNPPSQPAPLPAPAPPPETPPRDPATPRPSHRTA